MKIWMLLALPVLFAGCVAKEYVAPKAEVGAVTGVEARELASGLNNPSFVTFHPRTGLPMVCDTGNGRVVTIKNGKASDFIAEFKTEYWKVLSEDKKLYKLGPLAAIWADDDTFIVSDSGHPDGEDKLVFYDAEGNKTGESNTIGATSDDPKDKGEGNFTGFSMVGDTLYLCGQGSDAKTWVLKCDVKARKLGLAFSADEHGIDVNSPMQTLPWRGNLLVLYSGKGGFDDGTIVEWDLKTGEPVNQWRMVGIKDPMGLAQIPDSENEFVVTDNNWDLESVKDGALYRVKLEDKGQYSYEEIAGKLKGPVHCAFGPDGRLFVTLLGEHFDNNEGRLIALSGIK